MKKQTEIHAGNQEFGEEELVEQFVQLMKNLLPYVEKNAVHGAYYRNLGLMGAGIFGRQKMRILELLKDNRQEARAEKVAAVQEESLMVEGNLPGPLSENPVIVLANGLVTSGTDGVAGCDSCLPDTQVVA